MTSAAATEQNLAAGGEERRKLRTRSGEVFTASLQIDKGNRLTLRFKTGGYTVQRSVGVVDAPSRAEVLRLGWLKVREDKTAEKNEWTWVVP